MPNRRGQLLIASSRLRDPNFVKTVVLVVKEDDSGVIGLILNRPLEVTVAESCGAEISEAAGVSQPLRQGGPCPSPLMVLHAMQDLPEESPGEEVIPGVRFTAEREPIEAVMRHGARAAMFFAGYAGWAVQQLEAEIDEGAWLVAPTSAREVLAADAQMWQTLTSRLLLGKWIDPGRIPKDPRLN